MMKWMLLMIAGVALASCALMPETGAPDKIILTPVAFDDLQGWNQDATAEALRVFGKSCAVVMRKPASASLGVAGKAADWQQACAALPTVRDDDASARGYFENYFRAYAVSGKAGDGGLFTGYFVPELRGALQRGGVFQTPLYARPSDKIDVDLGAFKADLKGQHIVGKVAGNALVPYDDRAAIAAGSLDKRAGPLLWVDDPVSAFFLEVQGSGRVRLPDGNVMSVGYDGANGRAYVAIGRALADRGEIQRPVTMPAIRAWLAAHPERAQEVMNVNPSYVFFRRLPGADVLGAQGVGLTPARSLAVDPAFVPLGVPIWLDSADAGGAPLQRLLVAQDTGGAIKGVVRGDVFWGEGDAASAQAGAMQSRGRYYLLLPKTVLYGG